MKSAQVVLLRAINTQMPHATREEPAVPACSAVGAATIRRTLRAQDIVRVMPERRVFQTPVSSQSNHKRYSYTAAHRREADPQYSNLTNAEWALVADLFERPARKLGTAGSLRAPAHGRRLLLRPACRLRSAPVAIEFCTVAGSLQGICALDPESRERS